VVIVSSGEGGDGGAPAAATKLESGEPVTNSGCGGVTCRGSH
jgi:hypothetical protein